MKLTDILKQIIQEKKAKRDRCLRIADRKFNKPSAYKSGAVVRCRQGKIWKGLKEDNQPSEGSYQQALKDIKPIIPVLSHNLIHQQSLEHNEENMVKLNQKIFDLVKKGDGTILDRLWDLAGNSLLKNAINIITFYHKSNLSEAKKETLRTWFKRKGAPGKTGGWVDCNSPIRKDGKITGYKPCGRQKGEERAKYPSCRPTAARCKDKGKGTKWGKTK